MYDNMLYPEFVRMEKINQQTLDAEYGISIDKDTRTIRAEITGYLSNQVS